MLVRLPVPKKKPASPLRLTLIVCLVEIAGLSTIATFAALLPVFQQQWGLSHAAAGWISAAYYGGYVLWVPLLSAWTDRVDARRIMAVGAVVSMLAALGYALVLHAVLYLSSFVLGVIGIWFEGYSYARLRDVLAQAGPDALSI